MPDFTPAEISLARQLALPREFREGDWVIGRGRYETGEWADWSDPYPIHGDAVLANRGVEGAEWLWLPSVEDCFELLDREWASVEQLSSGKWKAEAANWGMIHDLIGATPREALYRLLLEVRG